MAETTEVKGHCLCGGVKFSAHVVKSDVGACHCSMCRRWSSGPFLALEHEGDVKIVGEDSLGVYRSSEWGERCFCRICGSALFWRLHDGGHYALSVGALDDQTRLRFASQIFIDEKPAFYDFANDTIKMTGAEFVAAFTGATSPQD